MATERHILVVDDDESVRSLVREILEHDGHVVREAGSGGAALELLKGSPANLVLLDVVMPDLDGFQVAQRIKQLPGPFIPVILVTALDDLTSRTRGIAVGADEVITKPVFPAELRLRVNALLRIQSLAEELHRTNRRLQRLLRTDDLTKVRNRRGLYVALRREYRRAARYGGPLSVLALDIDRFKAVNDTYGHAVGDQLLAACGQAMRRALRDVDVVGRTGGEEFVVVAPETPLDDAVRVAERVRAAVAATRVTAFDGSEVNISISCGLATLGAVRADSADELLRHADVALYRAKALGRDRLSVASMREEDDEAVSLPKALAQRP